MKEDGMGWGGVGVGDGRVVPGQGRKPMSALFNLVATTHCGLQVLSTLILNFI